MKTQKPINPRRAELIKLSEELRKIYDPSIHRALNDLIVAQYRSQGHMHLRSLEGWNQLGYLVKKGEKGLPIWRQKENITVKEESGEEKNVSFHGIAYLYSEHQVRKIE